MRINQQHIQELNQPSINGHQQSFNFLKDQLEKRNVDVYDIIQKLKSFQIAIPSWALGQGGTRFGRFSIGGEPRNLQEKIQDIGLLHALNGSSGAVSLHIPWDIPENVKEIKSLAESLNIKI
jgi:L-rhamnose isomerase/sugar isomerase